MHNSTSDIVAEGMGASPGRATGPIRFVKIDYPANPHRAATIHELETVTPNDVLVTVELLPQMVEVAEQAAAIVTIRSEETRIGSPMTSKAAVAARKWEIPAVTGCSNDFRSELTSGQQVIVDGNEGQISPVELP